MRFEYYGLGIQGEASAPTQSGDARNRGRARRTGIVAVIAFALVASGCGQTPPAAVDADPSSLVPSETATAAPALAPATETALGPLFEEAPVIPPVDVAEQVLAAAEQAAPESELSLQDCTDWIADPAISLEPTQVQDCAAKLAAAVDTCQELDCFAAPADTPPTDTTPTNTEQSDTTPADTGQSDEAPAVTPTTTSAASTATLAPATTAAPTTTQAPATTTAPPTTTVAPEEPIPAPEGGHSPLPLAEMIPRNEPYWDYPTCTGSPPWPSNCYPPSEWEIPQDLSDCRVAPIPDAGVGGICASREPPEIPRQTRDVLDFTEACQAGWHPISCEYLLFQMKWALDYLGAHPWCVLQQYYDRLAAHDDIWNRGASLPADIRNRHGWHLCPTVIDPGQDDDPRRRLSETGISLAEQCRIVLPPDVQLEDRPRRVNTEPQRFGSDCDAWAEWVENRPIARDWRDCDRSARLADEWMEHHYATPERYFIVTC